MAEPVHFASPFTFNHKGKALTNIQGSTDELDDCVFNICLCPINEREDLPEFGIPDETFQNVPLALGPVQEAVERWEPRVELSLEEVEEAIGVASRRIKIEVG